MGAAAPEAPLDLRIAGRVLLHSGLVGLIAAPKHPDRDFSRPEKAKR